MILNLKHTVETLSSHISDLETEIERINTQTTPLIHQTPQPSALEQNTTHINSSSLSVESSLESNLTQFMPVFTWLKHTLGKTWEGFTKTGLWLASIIMAGMSLLESNQIHLPDQFKIVAGYAVIFAHCIRFVIAKLDESIPKL
jgi:hypothetical protein